MRQQREEAFRQMFYSGEATIPILGLKIRREHLIADSLSELTKYPTEDLKKELKVYMVGEEAIDEGGVQKEWFQLVIKEIFHEKYGREIRVFADLVQECLPSIRTAEDTGSTRTPWKQPTNSN